MVRSTVSVVCPCHPEGGVATLRSPKPELNSPAYGYGFSILGEPGDRIVGHSGGFPGISGKLHMFLDSGFTAAIL
ncbi:MAG: hypothetical protein GY856_27745 [bacterium]|nr:hypothetical protein [bacterium]